MALPMPRLAPVMNKVRPASLLHVGCKVGGKGGEGRRGALNNSSFMPDHG